MRCCDATTGASVVLSRSASSGECSPEQIREWHGDIAEHVCEDGADAWAGLHHRDGIAWVA